MRKASMSLFALTVATSPGLVSQTVIPGGDVSGLWPQAQSPYHITGDITIPDDSTLTIEPGGVWYAAPAHVRLTAYDMLGREGSCSRLRWS